MDKGRLETQEVEESESGEAQATEATAAAVPPVPKRPTVAGLKKELDELKQDMNRDVLEWLGQLDIRLEEVETRTAAHNEALLGDVKTRLDIIEREPLAERKDVAADIAARLDAVEGATGTLADVMRSHIADTEGPTQTPAAAAGFTMAPVQPEEETTRQDDIREIIPQCQTMTDVLMICRTLKARQNITDEERKYLLDCACQIAGVTMTQGLQIRAGIQNAGT